LGSSKFIAKVKTYNRDDCCGDRLANYQVSVGNNSNVFKNPVCPGLHNGAETIDCNLTGRYVGVFMISSSGILTLCEVEFFSS